MIPVGTLCMIVDSRYRPEDVGRFCTTTGPRGRHFFYPDYIGYPIEQSGSDAYWASEKCLRPIVPPGNPDRVDTPAKEPAEIL